jgi:HEAT repeat protein
VSRKQSFIAVVIAGLLVIAGVVHYTRPSRPEPAYQGRTLTKWLKRLDDGQAFGISSGWIPSRTPARIEAAAAIRAMHAEAFPLLMQDIHASPLPNSFRETLNQRISSLTFRLTGRWYRFSDVAEEDRVRWRAAQGLAALGPLAKPGMPELERLLFTNYFHSSIKEAAYALATMGPEGIAILTNSMRPGSEWSTMCAIWSLGQHPEAGAQAIPFLIQATSSESEGIACGAIQVLGMLRLDAENVVPALTNAFNSPKPAVRRDACDALLKFSPRSGSDPAARTGVSQ